MIKEKIYQFMLFIKNKFLDFCYVLKSLYLKVEPYCDIPKFLYIYETTLNFFVKLLQITSNTLFSIVILLPDFSRLKLLYKTTLSIILYSKIILIISPFIPNMFPETLLNLATICWDNFATGFGILITQVSGFSLFIKEMAQQYLELNNLKERNVSQEKMIEELHSVIKNTVPVQVFNDEITRLQDEEIRYKTELKILETTNKNLSLQNADLSKSLSTWEGMNTMQKTQSVLTIIGNCAFISIQILNAINIYNNPTTIPTSSDIKRLVDSVNSLLYQNNLNNIRRTADERASSATTTPGDTSQAIRPVRGLTDHDHQTGEFFE
jgi:hypothetical protein